MSRMCQCTRKTIGKAKNNYQFWLLSTSFNTISNVLNFLGVVSVVSHQSLTHILLTLLSFTTYEPSWMSPSSSQAYFDKACVRDIHLRVKSLMWIIATLAWITKLKTKNTGWRGKLLFHTLQWCTQGFHLMAIFHW
jgi:hypothetical protein